MSEIARRICIVQMRDGNITGWMICDDLPEAIGRAQWPGQEALAAALSKLTDTPSGKTDLGDGYFMLTDPASTSLADSAKP